MNRQGSLRVREANKCTIKLPVSGKGPLATLSHGRGRKTSKEKSVRGRGRAKPAFITNLPLQSRAHSCNINPCMRMEPSRPGCCCPGDRGAHISPFRKQLARTQPPVCSRWHLENATIAPGREENTATEELRKSPPHPRSPGSAPPTKACLVHLSAASSLYCGAHGIGLVAMDINAHTNQPPVQTTEHTSAQPRH